MKARCGRSRCRFAGAAENTAKGKWSDAGLVATWLALPTHIAGAQAQSARRPMCATLPLRRHVNCSVGSGPCLRWRGAPGAGLAQPPQHSPWVGSGDARSGRALKPRSRAATPERMGPPRVRSALERGGACRTPQRSLGFARRGGGTREEEMCRRLRCEPLREETEGLRKETHVPQAA